MTDYEFSPGITLFCDISDGKKARPLVPAPWRDLILRMFHGLCHSGQAETLRRVAARYYWPKIREDVSNFVKTCSCQAVKIHKHIKLPPQHIEVPAKRFTQLMIDVVGPLPRSSSGMTHILTIIDRTSRFIQAIPMPEATAESCCQAFVEGWVSLFGLCRNAISDNGNTFVSKLWTKMHENLGTLVTYTPVYHSASLGHLERQHRDIKVSLKAALVEMGDKYGQGWSAALPWILLGKRTAYQPDIGASPAELVFGEPLLVPGDLAGADLAQDSSLPELLDKVRRNASRPAVQTSHHSNPKQYLPEEMARCTHVWVKQPPAKLKPLDPPYKGPYEIVAREGDTCIRIRVGTFVNGTQREELQHWENCKPAYFRDEPFSVDKPKLGRPSATTAEN